MLSTIWCTLPLLLSIAFSQTTQPPPLTAPDGCSANYAYVHVESSLQTLSKTITSERVNYPPYSYTQSVPRRKLIEFALNDPITDTSNNPCDTSTWTIPSINYDNSIILLKYSPHFATVCTPQQWTLNLQTYNTNIQAILIINTNDINGNPSHTYVLPGDNNLLDPIIPTRMISYSSYKNILNIINNTNEDIYASIDCFNNTSPALICTQDQSSIGNHVQLDGEFQKQANTFMNGHPVWLKEGMNGIWDDYYIWLTIDHSRGNNAYSWKWVIGTDYNDDTTITTECLAPWSDHMTDPTQCSGNWYDSTTHKLLGDLYSRNGICDLSDNYVCVDSGSYFFDYYFSGRYRQIHDGTAVWFGDNTKFDSYLSIQYVNQSFANGWSFVFSYAANGGVYAFCIIHEDSQHQFNSYTLGDTSGDLALSPWNCNKNWYVVIEDEASGGYKWFNDPLMDVDQCNHPDVSTTPIPDIDYPKYMCFMGENHRYSLYQTYFGIWTLDNSTENIYDNRHIYTNQRLSGLTQGEWYMLWYDEKDSWIIKEEIPDLTYSETYGGICRDNVNTPDLCTNCWEFYQGIHNEKNCDAKVKPILTNNEADCMAQPIPIDNYQDDVTVCFGQNHGWTGKWKLETRYLHDARHFWYLENEDTGDREFYMYYDNIWRYWILHKEFTDNVDEWYLRCLLWDELEPFKCQNWFTADGQIINMNTDCTLSPTIAPTPHPTIACIEYNKYVYAESPAFTNQIFESKEVNFPPYKSSTSHRIELVLFETHTDTTGNPCDMNSFVELPTYYDNKIVLIKWSSFFESLCSPQQWTLQLQKYANVMGVIISNDKDFNHVYALSGDDTLEAPIIPTRMIGQMAGILLEYTLKSLDPVWITFGCFDADYQYPNTICLVDTTIMGEHVFLDGEYQRQLVEKNDHPIWLKEGHLGLWNNIYMFLDVDTTTMGESSWKWVIGTDYNDRNSIIAECDLNGRHIDHPAECDLDWSIDGVLVSNISTKGNQCSFGDNYVCVESKSGGFFEHYFEGRYRQVHSGVPLWLLEDTLDAHIQIREITWPVMFDGTQFVFAFMVNQSDMYAFCNIGTEYPSQDVALAPYKCNRDWYVIDYDHDDMDYKWVIDMAFDIDECSHANISTTNIPINYPDQICLNDASGEYSHFQGHYGIYLLDTTQEFDGRYIYKNQRLDGIDGNEWYILWYDEKDSWVLNEMVPGQTTIDQTDGICREDVATPDLCVNSCWEFYQGHEMESMCNVKASIIQSNIESDCMGTMPVNNIIHYTKEINLCFDDGITSDWDNQYTGKWHLEPVRTHSGRAYWYMLDDAMSMPGYPVIKYYMFYDEYWRFWVIDRMLGRNGFTSWHYIHYYCLKWDEFEPFNCDRWYSALSYKTGELNMKRDCISSSPTMRPTAAPTINCDGRNSYISAETDQYVYSTDTLISLHTNFPPLMYDTFEQRDLVMFENGRLMEEHNSNPCDYYTWQEYPIYYENKVVMINYDASIADLCSVELWTLNLEHYANGKIFAVLISNNEDLNHVYALSGDLNLVSDSTVPTRMISQFAGLGITEAISMGENVYITMGCFDDVSGIDYPNIICLVDTSIIGKYIYLDGEYQRHATFTKNEHPIWIKSGFDGIFKEIYMWLDIDSTVSGASSWKWVIGSDYNIRKSILAECLLLNGDGNSHIDHPALCDGNWYINGQLENNITTSDNICELGDNYVCVESQMTSANNKPALFDSYFDGQYRQIHSGVPLWFCEDCTHFINGTQKPLNAYLTIGIINWPPLYENTYAFAFAMNQNEIYAFCAIGADYPSDEEVFLHPEMCNEHWYKLEHIEATGGYTWIEDHVFDIDTCLHNDWDLPFTTKPMQYPNSLCMNDMTNSYSEYQSHYGIYLLDTKQTYNGKYIYYNARLSQTADTTEQWYLLWNDAKDSWIINEIIPNKNMNNNKYGICRDNHEVETPNLCDGCWAFSDRNGKLNENCNVQISVMYDNHMESKCVPKPENHIANGYINEIIIGFDDGISDMHDNTYSGVWRLSQHATYNNRSYWYKYYNNNNNNNINVEIEYYMFYDSINRYWIVNNILGNANNIKLYCLYWREYEPWKCDIWYTNTVGLTMKMDTTYQLPVISTTSTSTTTTQAAIITTIIHDHHLPQENKKTFNIIPWLAMSVGVVTLFGGCILLFCYCRKKRKKRFMFKDVSADNMFKTVYGINSNPEEEDIINIVQMESVQSAHQSPFSTGYSNYKTPKNSTNKKHSSNFTKGKGEMIAMDSDDDNSDDDVISHKIIDDCNEGNGTGVQKNINKQSNEWVKFNQNNE